MATLRELKKRLGGVKTTKALAGAMKTVATAKYSRVNAELNGYSTYASRCERLLTYSDPAEKYREGEEDGKTVYVLISGNRGLCGGYNGELLSYFNEIRSKCGENALFVTCGKIAADFFRDKKIGSLAAFAVSDVPTFADSSAVSSFLRKLYATGGVSEIILIRQNFYNMLKQTPESKRFLPQNRGTESTYPGGDEVVFLPDRETVSQAAFDYCTDAAMYSVLLNCAAGAQAATIMAMRAAYDNANESESALETAINRRRQSEVTASVIETASDNYEQKGVN